MPKDNGHEERKFRPFDDDERRAVVRRFGEQSLAIKRMKAKLKLGQERADDLLEQIEKGGAYDEGQPALLMQDDDEVVEQRS